ncbi:BRO-N domain-containing protein [Symbiopectobacterium purcellii]|uniref:BRO-N domain-containing protein n=1 Tax=Symbiopectobacterium purcellii TaxID=2871826 RepID=UPI003F84EDAB
MNSLIFRNTVLETISHNEQIWFTSAELAKALHYKKTDAITQIYTRNLDEFTSQMSTTLNLRVVRKTGTVEMSNRIFSLRGAHLIAMFSNTPIAKEFRKWVLDILDSKVGQPVHQPEALELFTDDDTSHLARLIWGMANGFRFERSCSNAIWHALRYAAGVPSPQHFGVSHIPILAEECQRIYSFTNALKEVMYDAEKQAVRRVLKNREDADAVVSEMKQLLDETNQSHNLLLTNTLARWQQADIQQFLQRH